MKPRKVLHVSVKEGGAIISGMTFSNIDHIKEKAEMMECPIGVEVRMANRAGQMVLAVIPYGHIKTYMAVEEAQQEDSPNKTKPARSIRAA